MSHGKSSNTVAFKARVVEFQISIQVHIYYNTMSRFKKKLVWRWIKKLEKDNSLILFFRVWIWHMRQYLSANAKIAPEFLPAVIIIMTTTRLTWQITETIQSTVSYSIICKTWFFIQLMIVSIEPKAYIKIKLRKYFNVTY